MFFKKTPNDLVNVSVHDWKMFWWWTKTSWGICTGNMRLIIYFLNEVRFCGYHQIRLKWKFCFAFRFLAEVQFSFFCRAVQYASVWCHRLIWFWSINLMIINMKTFHSNTLFYCKSPFSFFFFWKQHHVFFQVMKNKHEAMKCKCKSWVDVRTWILLFFSFPFKLSNVSFWN